MNDVITVLVAGHRPDRLSADAAGSRLFDDLEKLLALLRGISNGGRATLRLLTGIADGTDDATARIAERLHLPLHLLAPGQPQPLNQHQQRAERVVWLGASDCGLHGGEAFAIRDEIALSFSDMLVVVWDGESPQDISGGTVRLAFQAALMMKPVVWLATDGTVRMLDLTRLTPPYLHKLRCSRPEPIWLRDCFTATLDEIAQRNGLNEAVGRILNPVASNARDVRRLADYRAEAISHSTPLRAGHTHEVLMALVRADLKILWRNLSSKVFEEYLQPKEAIYPIAPPPLIQARFRVSDIEGTIAAGRHRDSIWLIYGASAMAVFAAVAGAIGLWAGMHSALWPIAELLLIGLIVSTFAVAKNMRWHGKWLSHRFIAEQLRYARMCLPILGVPRPFTEPVWHVRNGALTLSNVELWYLQRTLTAEGLPSNADSSVFVASAESAREALSAYVSSMIGDQQKYHYDNKEKRHTEHKRLETLEISLFWASGLAVLAHFALHANWLLICTAFFPALAAAVYGLATKLEIRRLEGQSAMMANELSALAVAVREAGRQAGWTGWIRLRELTLQAARIMSDENGQWQQLVSHQEVGLP